ncbi:hypothetical protein NA56DRAFT_708594 [Hyaloscypha hepaticicola]|uniref:REJ domain-containing protein n=1 Tax=Hyaloscypha hepaticicola TaxID=2082293 RepID=A0A2J6PRP2_9HELO|nr:hypothetical protein NA56DRAFT_708594 [Hyaloscypha hepaticicola]
MQLQLPLFVPFIPPVWSLRPPLCLLFCQSARRQARRSVALYQFAYGFWWEPYNNVPSSSANSASSCLPITITAASACPSTCAAATIYTSSYTSVSTVTSLSVTVSTIIVTQNVTFTSVRTQVLASVIYLDVTSTQTALETLEDVPLTEISTVVDSVTVSPVSTVLLATVVYLTTTET